jgi:hypothetical protein
VAVEPALVDYPTQFTLSTAREDAGDGRAALKSASATLPQAALIDNHEVSVTLPAGGPAQVGVPYTVTLRLGRAEPRPIHGVAFNLDYDYDLSALDRFFLLDVNGAPDLAGPYGTYKMHNSLAGFNRISEITDTAVVRLGGDQGLTSGDLVKITFLPLVSDEDASYDNSLFLHGVKVADTEGRQFSPDYRTITYVPIEASEAAAALIDPNIGGEVISTVGLTASVRVPPDALTETVALVYGPLDDPEPPLPATLRFAGRAFRLDAYQAGSAVPTPLTFDPPLTVTISYRPTATADLDPARFALWTWNAAQARWEDASCGPVRRDPAAHAISVPVCHLSEFALVEKVRTLYLPLVLR